MDSRVLSLAADRMAKEIEAETVRLRIKDVFIELDRVAEDEWHVVGSQRLDSVCFPGLGVELGTEEAQLPGGHRELSPEMLGFILPQDTKAFEQTRRQFPKGDGASFSLTSDTAEGIFSSLDAIAEAIPLWYEAIDQELTRNNNRELRTAIRYLGRLPLSGQERVMLALRCFSELDGLDEVERALKYAKANVVKPCGLQAIYRFAFPTCVIQLSRDTSRSDRRMELTELWERKPIRDRLSALRTRSFEQPLVIGLYHPSGRQGGKYPMRSVAVAEGLLNDESGKGLEFWPAPPEQIHLTAADLELDLPEFRMRLKELCELCGAYSSGGMIPTRLQNCKATNWQTHLRIAFAQARQLLRRLDEEDAELTLLLPKVRPRG